jgi:K(+)-stimulated pyrophosphate-energized sodium pump
MLGIVAVAAIGALAFAAINYGAVKKLDTGTGIMQEMAGAIQEGADAFIRHEYKVIGATAVFIAVILGVIVSWYTGVTFLFGAVMSGSAGWVGMKIATLANVRVANRAKESKSLGSTLKVAFQGGSVMGLSVAGFSMLGLGIVYLVFGILMGQTDGSQLTVISNWLGVNFIPFTMTVSGYALGCSIIAMFDRVGGGIYTKAADMGADLVGKTEAHIPEDDPRNPATIADNVGDNVGDIAGLGADLLESYVGSIISVVVLSAYMFHLRIDTARELSQELVERMVNFPVIFAAIGILASIIGILFLVAKKPSDNPHNELNVSTWSAAGITLVATGIFAFFYFQVPGLEEVGFMAGALSPWIAAIFGILSGILIGQFAEYYTSYDYGPTRSVSSASRSGVALTITQGIASGMKSVMMPLVMFAVAVLAANAVAGLYGVAMAAVGMLSFVAATVSVDSYGPIADNAGGIAEQAELDPYVRNITDRLDSVGNTTAAIGKGFAIGSAGLAALSLFASYIYAQAGPADDINTYTLILDIINPWVLAGGLVGAALPFFFSGVLIEAVANAAQKMVQEVRRQFREDPKILTGESRPDYRLCIEISSAGALAEMKFPALLAVLTPIATGFIFGPQFVGGLMIGTLFSGIMLALFNANSGGSWDNAKKYIEQGNFGGKGSEAHDASVVGDTVGDPLKDTVGPALDILIKIMAMVSLIMTSAFGKYNLFSVFF